MGETILSTAVVAGSTLDRVTPVILTYNEAPNIARTLGALSWAKRIVIVDSNSTDETLAIAEGYPAVQVYKRAFDNHADQWNYGLAQVQTDWVLSLDADYVLTDAVTSEIAALPLHESDAGYEAPFTYCVFGRPLRASLYPPRVVVFRRDLCTYVNEGHTQRLQVQGPVHKLRHAIRHDDWKPLSRWFTSQQAYARREADFLLGLPKESLSLMHRLRLLGFLTPPLVFFYTLLVKRCIFDGWPGILYVLQRTVAETMIALEIVDRKVRGMVEASRRP